MSARLRLRAGRVVPNQFWSQVFASANPGDSITVPAGQTIIYDVPNSIAYNDIQVNGVVVVDSSQATQLNFNSMTINSGGAWRAGTVATPYPRQAGITHTLQAQGPRASDGRLSNPQTNTSPSSNRAILVMDGGELSLVAAVPARTVGKLGNTAAALASSITAADNWTLKAGDVLELTTSMYYTEGIADASVFNNEFPGVSGTRRPGYGREMVTVASDVNNSTTIPITSTSWPSTNNTYPTSYTSQSTLKYTHHGKLQYVVAPAHEDQVGSRLSYTNTAILSGDIFGTVNGTNITGADVLASQAAGSPTLVDNRSTLGLMTHPIKVQAPADSDWTTYGYGVHVMVMGNTSKRMLQGVQVQRCGQAGFLGSYPIHDHMRSYTRYGVGGSGTFLGDLDPTYNFTKSCSIWQSSNRGHTTHGTCGTLMSGCVFADIDTHCIFLEDGSEERNTYDGNLVSGVGSIRYGLDPFCTMNAQTSGTLLTVNSITSGTLVVGQHIFTGGYTYVGTVVEFVSGAGTTGTYRLNNSGTNLAQTMYASKAIKVHDVFNYAIAPATQAGGASGIWFTNPENHLKNNIFSGCYHGIWNAFTHPYYTGYTETGTRAAGGTITFFSNTQDQNTAVNTGTPAAMHSQVITLTCDNNTTPGSELWRRDGSIDGNNFTTHATTDVTATHGTNGVLNGYQYRINPLPSGAAYTLGDTFQFTVKRFLGVFGASRDVVLTSGTVSAYGAAPGWNELALEHYNNEAHSCAHDNMTSQPFNLDEYGRTFGPNSHQAIGQRIPVSAPSLNRFKIEKINMWKGGYCNYQNESDSPWYLNWTSSAGREKTPSGGISEMIQGNVGGGGFNGGRPAEFDGCLFAVKTLDDYYASWGGGGAQHQPNIMVSYGGGIRRVNSTFIPQEPSTYILEGGSTGTRPIMVENGNTMRLWDFYVYAVNQHFAQDHTNVIIGAGNAAGYFGVRAPPVHMFAANYPTTELTSVYTPTYLTNITQWNGSSGQDWAQGNAGAMQLPSDGSMFKQNGGWWIHNRPAISYGTSGAVNAQSTSVAPNLNGLLIGSSYQFIGVRPISFNGVSMATNSPAFNFDRMQADGVTPVTNGDWHFGDVFPVSGYTVMKHMAVLSHNTGGTPVQMGIINGTGWGGTYPPQSCVIQTLLNSCGSSDHFVLKVKFDHTSVGSFSWSNVSTGGATTFTSFPDAGSLANLLSAVSNASWIDTANDWLYIHFWCNGTTNPWAGDTYNTDRKLQNEYNLTIT